MNKYIFELEDGNCFEIEATYYTTPYYKTVVFFNKNAIATYFNVVWVAEKYETDDRPTATVVPIVEE